MSNRRSLIILFSIAALSFILLASYIGNSDRVVPQLNSNQDPASGEGSVSLFPSAEYELHVAVAFSEREFQTLSEWNGLFEARVPNIRVTLVNVNPETAYEHFWEKASLGEQYDIVLLENEWMFDFATNGLIAPVPQEAAADLADRPPPALVPLLRWNGYTWGVSMDLNPYVLVWHPDAIGGTGLDGTSSFQEWWVLNEQVPFRANAESGGTEGTAGPSGPTDGSAPPEGEEESAASVEYGLYFDALDPHALVSLMWAAGVVEGDESGSHFQLSAPEALDPALQLFQGRAPDKREAGPPRDTDFFFPLEGQGFDAWGLLKEGRMASRIAPLSEYSLYGRAEGLEAGLLPGSSPERSPSVWIRGRSWAVLSRSQAKEQAFQWIEAMTRHRPLTALAEAAGTLPASDSAILAGKDKWPEMLAVPWFQEARTFPAMPDYMKRLTIYRNSVKALWEQEMDWQQFRTAIHQIWHQTSSPLF